MNDYEFVDKFTPSENFILKQRLITFADEWLFYILLCILYYTAQYQALAIVVLIGSAMIGYSYVRLWEMERKRFK